MIGGIFQALVKLIKDDPLKVIHYGHMAYESYKRNSKDEDNDDGGNPKYVVKKRAKKVVKKINKKPALKHVVKKAAKKVVKKTV